MNASLFASLYYDSLRLYYGASGWRVEDVEEEEEMLQQLEEEELLIRYSHATHTLLIRSAYATHTQAHA